MSVASWFIPGEGIDRNIITSGIQRYLGNDATVKPGMGQGEFQNIPGYYIRAFRNLTSEQVQDLRKESLKERLKKQAPTAVDPRHAREHVPTYPPHSGYGAAPSYHSQGQTRLMRPGGDSPIGMDTTGYPGYSGAGLRPNDRYGGPPPQSHRMPNSNMDVDMDDIYGQPHPSHHRFEDESRRFGDARLYEQERAPYHDTRLPYSADPPYNSNYRPTTGAGPGSYAPDSRLGQGMDYRAEPRVGLPYGGTGPVGGYGRQSDAPFGYPPTTSAPPDLYSQQAPYASGSVYHPPPGPPPVRMDGRDTRYGPIGDYPSDRDTSRYAYPSPESAVIGIRDGMPRPPSPSGYGGPGQSTLSSTYNFDSRTGPPLSNPTYAPVAGGAYHSGTSPSTMTSRLPPGRTDATDDGERPSRRMRHA